MVWGSTTVYQCDYAAGYVRSYNGRYVNLR